MIKNESLANRLNDFKNKKDQPKDKLPIASDSIFNTLAVLFTGIMLVVKIFVFGYSLKLVCNTNWNLLGIVSIGLTINFLLTYIHDLIHKKSDNNITL